MADFVHAYWSPEELFINGVLFLHILGAFALGTLIGYERTFHGHAAGMRTYALVCTASTILIVINAYPAHWYGGLGQAPAVSDPTRVVQGLVTGIGFLCAGVIIKEGFTIRGLSTSASIWMTAAIGIVVGLGFYGTAIAATGLTMLAMSGFRLVENRLPQQCNAHFTLVYEMGHQPDEGEVRALVESFGYRVIDLAYHSQRAGHAFSYTMVLQARAPGRQADLVRAFASSEQLMELKLAPSRN
jgi:putative Mg2+ transporter-C (MgtC) family protein